MPSIENPFSLTESEIRELIGEHTESEVRCIKAVLSGIRQAVHQTNLNNGMTHSHGCWSWGPAHYPCAYNRITAMLKERPALSDNDVRLIVGAMDVDFNDAKRIVRAVEEHYLVGAR